MAISDVLLTKGYYVGRIEELVDDISEFELICNRYIYLAELNKHIYFKWRLTSGSGIYYNKIHVDFDQVINAKQYLKEQNIQCSQHWWETIDVDDEIVTMYRYFNQQMAKLAKNIYPELTDDNITQTNNFSLYENGDFIERHRDGRNPGRLCGVLIYLSAADEYNDGGGKLILDDDKIKETILPLRGNFVLLDFSKHDIYHTVEPVRNNFKRHSYISFITNKDKLNEHSNN